MKNIAQYSFDAKYNQKVANYSNVIYTDKRKMLAIEPVDYVNFEKKPIYSNEFLRPMAKDFKPYFLMCLNYG